MFIGRNAELNYLNNAYNSSNAEFIVLYGRRRVGKTETLIEFCKDKPNIFYACNEYTDKKQFAAFSDALLDYDYSFKKKVQRFVDWSDAFSHLGELASNEKLVIVIDEFPYMVRGDKSIPSVLQNLWDHKLKNANIMLILCGSSISFMEDELLAAKNPLYGRTTGIYKMLPMPYYDAVKFFPDYSNEDKLIAYSILGGIPHYLKQFNPALSLAENIKTKILTNGTVLFNEATYILHQELREPAVYITIIESIALGNNKINEISDKTQIDTSRLSVYMRNLLELGLIQREFPVLTKPSEFAKKNQGEYKVSDDFFRFWFSYAYGYMSDLSKGNINMVYDDVIGPDLHNFASKAFENVCIDYMYKLNAEKKLPFKFHSIGRWWGKVTHREENSKPHTVSEEIDILAADKDEKNYIIGECKFTNDRFDIGQLKALKAKLMPEGQLYYYLFALNGFTDAVIRECDKSNDLRLVTLDEIM